MRLAANDPNSARAAATRIKGKRISFFSPVLLIKIANPGVNIAGIVLVKFM